MKFVAPSRHTFVIHLCTILLLLLILIITWSEVQEQRSAPLSVVVCMVRSPSSTRGAQEMVHDNNRTYLINTTTCKILNLDPFDESVASYFQDVVEPVTCSVPFVTEHERTLYMKISREEEQVACCYRSIERVMQDPIDYNSEADSTIILSDECHPVEPGQLISIIHPYMRVDCAFEEVITFDYFATVQPPEHLPAQVQKKLQRWADLEEPRPPNILIFGLDATSRLHSIRALARTRALLLEEDFIEMYGYTKVGSNTMPNIMAALTGLKMFDNDTFTCASSRDIKFDDCPFIWQNFSQHGYLTAFAEDYPTQGAFNYLTTGFVEQPTDYYIRPIMVAAKKYGGNNCTPDVDCCMHGGLTSLELVMKFVLDILALGKARGFPTFTFVWLVGPNHDDMNNLRNYDSSLEKFFDSILKGANYESDNTAIFFLGDHGYRMGSFRETFHGFYEDSLPMFLVRIPPQFPQWRSHLLMNQHALTSTYDFHEMLQDLLQLSAPKERLASGFHSLFSSVVPKNRTCTEAGVRNQDCLCSVQSALELEPDDRSNSNDTAKLTKFSQFVVDRINGMIRDLISDKTCTLLKLKSILYGRVYTQSSVSLSENSTQDYLIGIEVSPSGGTFEAYVREYANGSLVVEGEVCRLNMYRGQADCIKDKLREKYCYCQNLLPTQSSSS